ncbi:PIN domain protein [Leptospira santarosai]|uniref:PIN domain protein n=1 Tax=Leptospira santarosai TaxID=28183 RepID=UPI000965F5E1|nr:PIN domain protein [Leptospira santarosai]OLY64295.1 PIN domain protein [Leptospira santarosai serovar Grippotyphosa]ONF77983.1 PIN domain protein [Leptospira santarosai serovar Bananal]
MSRIERVYVDTSVYGGYFDKEFAEQTEKFFEEVDRGKFKLVISPLVTWELRNSPIWVREFYSRYYSESEILRITKEAMALGDAYLLNKVVGKSSRRDCIHIACATIAKVDVLISWNFKHIVRLDRIQGYNVVNEKLGYSSLEIRDPMEVLNYD